MTVAFKFHLSPESRARLEAQYVEISRLAGLTPRWLGAELLRLARRARAECCTYTAFDNVYDAQFVWHGVPELARRLGAGPLSADEVAASDWTALSDYALRVRLGHCVANISRTFYYWHDAWEILLNEPANGNPVVMGIDYLCPGIPGDKDDPLTRRLVEIAGCRGVPYDGRWDIGFMRDGASGGSNQAEIPGARPKPRG